MGFTYAWGIGVEQWDFDGLVRHGMCVYDIGANCGQSTLSLARAVGTSGRVVAFEPVDSVFANLVANLQLNPSLQVTPVCAAAYERKGRLEFLFRRDEVTQGRLADVEPTYAVVNAETIMVRAVRLDDYNDRGVASATAAENRCGGRSRRGSARSAELDSGTPTGNLH